jgi:hypothetical protein
MWTAFEQYHLRALQQKEHLQQQQMHLSPCQKELLAEQEVLLQQLLQEQSPHDEQQQPQSPLLARRRANAHQFPSLRLDIRTEVRIAITS